MVNVKLVLVSLMLFGGVIMVCGQDNGIDFDFEFDFESVTNLPNQAADATIVDSTGDFPITGGAQRDMKSSLDTALFVVYSIVTFFGLIGNILVFFLIIAGKEIGKYRPNPKSTKIWINEVIYYDSLCFHPASHIDETGMSIGSFSIAFILKV